MKGLVSFVFAIAVFCLMLLLPTARAVACDHAQQFNAGGCYAESFAGSRYAESFRAHHHYGGQNFRAQQQDSGYQRDEFRAGFKAGQRAQQNGGPPRVTTRTRRGLFGSVTTTVER